jgi:MFS superfamily sulfate permease-like transporter
MNTSYLSYLPVWVLPLLVVLVVWELFWKSASMWHAARKKDIVWFFILLVFNTLGILDIIYLFGFEKNKPDKLFK